MILYLYSRHNYSNRRIIKYNTIEEYDASNDFEYVSTIPNINFIPNDGITTQQIVNYSDAEYALGSKAPSYLIVVDEAYQIVSRWWVTESTLTRVGQAKLSLLRDVVADYLDSILTCPSFIKKGYISSVNDSAIFNNEEMAFNQIKTAEYKIKDASQCPWFVGYINKNATTEISVLKSTVTVSGTYANLEDYPYSDYIDNKFSGDYSHLVFKLLTTAPGGTTIATGWDSTGSANTPIYNVSDSSGFPFGSAVSTTSNTGFTINQLSGVDWTEPYLAISEAASRSSTNWKNQSYYYTNANKSSTVNDLLKQDNTFIQVGNTVYRVLVQDSIGALTETTLENTSSLAASYRSVALNANAIVKSKLGITDNVINLSQILGPFAAIEYQTYEYQIKLVEQPEATISYTLPVDRQHTLDAPYDLIAIPADFIWAENQDYSIDTSLSKQVVDSLIVNLGTEAFDWQLVPYCPLSDSYFVLETTDQSRINLSRLKTNEYTLIGDSSNYTFVLYLSESNFSKRNNQVVLQVPNNPIDFKIANECDSYRLCSPNYNGQFEFSATKNNGVSEWLITCTYKPFNPYIKVSPLFNGLYGRNFWDARGLVCGGDFSISQTSDAWVQYELQNKNYQTMFDRQITNMEVNNSMQRIQEWLSVPTNALTTGVNAGLVGGISGNPIAGAVTGAIAGGLSLGAGIGDIVLNEKLRSEAMDYAKDQFGYQLQNIKALPYSLTKVGSQTKDYKKWPFVEYYTCTEIEKNALRNKITYNGMTVGRIGSFNEFIGSDVNFIQGKPIRLDITEESHVVDVINSELQTGVYVL